MIHLNKIIRKKLRLLLIIEIIGFSSISILQNLESLNYIGEQTNFDNKLINSSVWDADEWSYKREITLTPATPEPDYQIRVDLNPSNFNYSHTKPDGGDIRFYDLNQTLLDYWIESWNPAGSSIIWVKIPSAGTSTIYMYYGNPTALSLSNGTNTFMFFDDFEGASLDPLKWDTEIGSYCGISVSSGYVRVYSATPSAFAIFVEVGFTDFEGVQGVPFSGYYTNGHAMAWPSTDTTWFTGEIRILNSTYAPFYKNDVFDSADTSTRTGPLPTRFFSHSCVGGSGDPYWAYISSIDTSLGVPGRAVRFEGWVDLVGIADFRMDWVFVFKFNESNPNVNVGEEIIIYNQPPEIVINSPLSGEFFSNLPPFFDISVIDINLNTTWYTISDGVTNITFSGLTGIINQTEWNALPEGPVIIRFYANDSWGYIGNTDVMVIKDITTPIITIYEPIMNEEFGYNSPIFNISIDESNLDNAWYTIDGGLTNYPILGNIGAIDQVAWNNATYGTITINFYAKDKAGNEGYNQVIVIKKRSSKDDFVIIVIISIIGTVVGVSLAIVLIYKSKAKKSQRPSKDVTLGFTHCPLCHNKIKPGDEYCAYCGNVLRE